LKNKGRRNTKATDFLLKAADFLLKAADFLLKAADFLLKSHRFPVKGHSRVDKRLFMCYFVKRKEEFYE